ncbi:hypothetical protein ABT187_48450, partial [Streptomyces sp. NPDC001817]|uniref:hypothetical protein n=1 Tax=Streptomyces sp. NPDC001817 TaxID=3154398 RepID=UPI00331EEA4D
DTRPAVTADGSTDTGAGNVTTHTVHTYDAYDRLTTTVLHDGDNTQGKIVKQTDYAINASGDVTRIKTTDADGKTSETVNEIDAAGRRTAVTTSDGKAKQVWDAAGNLTRDRQGNTIAYNPDNKPTTITPTQLGQAEVAIAYWADGSRRSATTTDGEGSEQTTTYHYTPTGTLANDTTGDLTASYLATPHGREHRTLTHNGTPAPADTAGAGYLTTDRRGNTLTLTNHEGTITSSFYYEDYGRPTTHHATPLTPDPQADRAHTNPIQYGGEYTNTWDHTQYTPARTYTPDGYFTTRDTYQLHNRHQAFNTDPINHTDPTGHISIKPAKTADRVSGRVIGAAAAGGYLTAAALGATAIGGTITGTLDEGQAWGVAGSAAGGAAGGIGLTFALKKRVKGTSLSGSAQTVGPAPTIQKAPTVPKKRKVRNALIRDTPNESGRLVALGVAAPLIGKGTEYDMPMPSPEDGVLRLPETSNTDGLEVIDYNSANDVHRKFVQDFTTYAEYTWEYDWAGEYNPVIHAHEPISHKNRREMAENLYKTSLALRGLSPDIPLTGNLYDREHKPILMIGPDREILATDKFLFYHYGQSARRYGKA